MMKIPLRVVWDKHISCDRAGRGTLIGVAATSSSVYGVVVQDDTRQLIEIGIRHLFAATEEPAL